MEDRNDELYHYGVLGMKWGVRRARNLRNSADKTYGRHYRALSKADENYLLASPNNKYGRRYQRAHKLWDKAQAKTKKADRIEEKLNESDQKYRDKQLTKVDKYYDKNRRSGFFLLSKNEGLKSLQKKVGNEKYDQEDLRSKIEIKQYMKEHEKTRVSQLTRDEIYKEKVAVGKSIATDILLSAGLSAVGMSTIGVVYGQFTSPQAVRSRERFKNNN